ncbi:hypothetical protein NLU13_1300 [Sarocladium strictum]|uniref:WSC domain-containing protein n=1 Tax=Sarocladium strictum TaxID=5046 RepID=A0AA39LBN3_SARSR|nr:hypothetical protein NLU13_1300 [Sarocladium strictum]
MCSSLTKVAEQQPPTEPSLYRSTFLGSRFVDQVLDQVLEPFQQQKHTSPSFSSDMSFDSLPTPPSAFPPFSIEQGRPAWVSRSLVCLGLCLVFIATLSLEPIGSLGLHSNDGLHTHLDRRQATSVEQEERYFERASSQASLIVSQPTTLFLTTGWDNPEQAPATTSPLPWGQSSKVEFAAHSVSATQILDGPRTTLSSVTGERQEQDRTLEHLATAHPDRYPSLNPSIGAQAADAQAQVPSSVAQGLAEAESSLSKATVEGNPLRPTGLVPLPDRVFDRPVHDSTLPTDGKAERQTFNSVNSPNVNIPLPLPDSSVTAYSAAPPAPSRQANAPPPRQEESGNSMFHTAMTNSGPLEGLTDPDPSCPPCTTCQDCASPGSIVNGENDSTIGPCSGQGFKCDECLNGWFCPPQETPAQVLPCGLGWPCFHCTSGSFCIPDTTPAEVPGRGDQPPIPMPAPSPLPPPGDQGLLFSTQVQNNLPISSSVGLPPPPAANAQPGPSADLPSSLPPEVANPSGPHTDAFMPTGYNGGLTGEREPSPPNPQPSAKESEVIPFPSSPQPSVSEANPAPPSSGPPSLGSSSDTGGSLWKYVGCFQDDVLRTLVGARPLDYVRGDVSPVLCAAHCEAEGLPLAGVENGEECWCGQNIRDSAIRIPESCCEMPCRGNPEATCGGPWAIGVFLKA